MLYILKNYLIMFSCFWNYFFGRFGIKKLYMEKIRRIRNVLVKYLFDRVVGTVASRRCQMGAMCHV